MAAHSTATDLQRFAPREGLAVELPRLLGAVGLGIAIVGLAVVTAVGVIEIVRTVVPTVLGGALTAMAHPAPFAAW